MQKTKLDECKCFLGTEIHNFASFICVSFQRKKMIIQQTDILKVKNTPY